MTKFGVLSAGCISWTEIIKNTTGRIGRHYYYYYY